MRLPEVPAVRKLADVFPKVLGRHMDMSSGNRPLQLVPMAFERVGVMDATDVLLAGVVHRAMRVAETFEALIAWRFIRADDRARRDVVDDVLFKNSARDAWDRASPQPPVTLDDTHDDSFVGAFGASNAVFLIPTHHRFVDLDMTAERTLIVGLRHQLAKFMAHAPRGFVRAADLPLDLFRGDAVPSAGHQVHREKPMRQFGARFVKDCVGARVDMMAAFLAGKRAAVGHRVEMGMDAATRTVDLGATVLHVHDLAKAGRVIGVFGLKFLERVLAHSALQTCIEGIA